MQKFKGVIYQAVNIQNRKSYIGQTIQGINRRKKDHENQKTSNIYFYNALGKYGSQNFKWIILGEIFADTREELKKKLNEAEIESIWVFRTFGSNGKTFDRIYGYNMTEGGKGSLGSKKSEKSKEKNRQAHLGKKASLFTRELMSSQRKGRNHTVESKLLMSIRHKGKFKTEEHKKNISLSRIQKGTAKGKNNPRYIEVDVELIFKLKSEGQSINSIAKILNVGRAVILNRLRNKDNYL